MKKSFAVKVTKIYGSDHYASYAPEHFYISLGGLSYNVANALRYRTVRAAQKALERLMAERGWGSENPRWASHHLSVVAI